MRRYTIDDVMLTEPCIGWTRERVTALFAAHKTVAVTLPQILRCAELLDDDALWIVSGLSDRRTRVLLGVLAAEQVEDLMPPASRACLEVCRRWLDGKADDAELAAVAETAAETAEETAAEARAEACSAAMWAAWASAVRAVWASEAACSAACSAAVIRELWLVALEAS